MNQRLVSILNTLGCLALSGCLLFQWFVQRDLEENLKKAKEAELNEGNLRLEAEKRVAQLDIDVAAMKEALTAAKARADENAQAADSRAEESQKLVTQLQTAHDQFKAWEAAIQSRDAKIKQLDDALGATRRRLDDAIAKLKEVKGAQ